MPAWLLRSDNLTETGILDAYHAILNNSAMARNVENLQKETNRLSDQKIFVRFISALLI